MTRGCANATAGRVLSACTNCLGRAGRIQMLPYKILRCTHIELSTGLGRPKNSRSFLRDLANVMGVFVHHLLACFLYTTYFDLVPMPNCYVCCTSHRIHLHSKRRATSRQFSCSKGNWALGAHSDSFVGASERPPIEQGLAICGCRRGHPARALKIHLHGALPHATT
eukprot:5668991-Amphidinium_carterae.1